MRKYFETRISQEPAEPGRARLALSKTRMERRQAAVVAKDLQEDHGKEEGKAAAIPPDNFRDADVTAEVPPIRKS